MNKFKVGDKVKCILSERRERDNYFNEGSQTVVASVEGEYYFRAPNTVWSMLTHNWQLVEEKPETKTHFVKLELEGIRPLSEEEAFKGILAEEKPEDQIEDFVVNAAKEKPEQGSPIFGGDGAVPYVVGYSKTTEINLPCESVTEITLKAEKGKTVIVKWI